MRRDRGVPEGLRKFGGVETEIPLFSLAGARIVASAGSRDCFILSSWLLEHFNVQRFARLSMSGYPE